MFCRGKLALQKQRIDVATVVNNAIQTSRPLIDEAGHKLTVNLSSEPLMLEADPMRLAQVFSNLLNNAAKFTDSGGDIGVAIERQDDQAVIRVSDSGIGISPDLLPKIFDMFFQGSTVTERKHGGLGLGLTLARDIVEFHGGTVVARSDGSDRGSEFVVSLPLSEAPSSTNVTDSEPAKTRSVDGQSPTRIVVVDDNKNQALSLQRLLQAMGHDVRVAHDGSSAMKLMLNFVPNVALIDLGLPKINGYELGAVVAPAIAI
jgi:two-component sensor histidine kinase